MTSDEEHLITIARQQLKGTVITYDAKRSANGNPVHYNKEGSPQNVGSDILVEVLLLSLFNFFVYTKQRFKWGPGL